MSTSLKPAIESALGISVTGMHALSGGCIGEVYRITLSDGSEAVAKIDQSATPRLDIEGYMLEYLSQHSALPVPRVRHSSPELLVMDLLEGDSRFTQRAECHAAELLAELHALTNDRFGLDRATLIGALHQPNPWGDSWVDFFREHRLLEMSRHAQREGRMSANTLKRIERFADNLDKWLLEPEHPSLVHGDVWTTNVLASTDGITGFIDPAIYYGHAEIELAFITLFSTFGGPFFERYESLRPIEPGFFDLRREIYTLYPLLVHVRLFGGGYLSSVEGILTKFGY